MDQVITLVSGFAAGAAQMNIEVKRTQEASGLTDAEWWEINAPTSTGYGRHQLPAGRPGRHHDRRDLQRGDQPRPVVPVRPGSDPGRCRALHRAAVRGRLMTDLVLVHGSTQSAAGFAELVAGLEAAGHRALTVCIPSAAAETSVEYADLLAGQLPELDRPVVVAHSASGLLLPALAERLAARLQVWLAGAVADFRAGRSFIDEVRADPQAVLQPDWIGIDPTSDPVLATHFLFHDASLPRLRAGLATLELCDLSAVYAERPPVDPSAPAVRVPAAGPGSDAATRLDGPGGPGPPRRRADRAAGRPQLLRRRRPRWWRRRWTSSAGTAASVRAQGTSSGGDVARLLEVGRAAAAGRAAGGWPAASSALRGRPASIAAMISACSPATLRGSAGPVGLELAHGQLHLAHDRLVHPGQSPAAGGGDERGVELDVGLDLARKERIIPLWEELLVGS